MCSEALVYDLEVLDDNGDLLRVWRHGATVPGREVHVHNQRVAGTEGASTRPHPRQTRPNDRRRAAKAIHQYFKVGDCPDELVHMVPAEIGLRFCHLAPVALSIDGHLIHPPAT